MKFILFAIGMLFFLVASAIMIEVKQDNQSITDMDDGGVAVVAILFIGITMMLMSANHVIFK